MCESPNGVSIYPKIVKHVKESHHNLSTGFCSCSVIVIQPIYNVISPLVKSGLKITVGHRTMSDQKQKTQQTFCPTGKIWGKIKCSTRLCFCPTINWKCPIKLLILFLINKLQYSKYRFLHKHLYYIERNYRNVTLSHSFLCHHLQTNRKKQWM